MFFRVMSWIAQGTTPAHTHTHGGYPPHMGEDLEIESDQPETKERQLSFCGMRSKCNTNTQALLAVQAHALTKYATSSMQLRQAVSSVRHDGKGALWRQRRLRKDIKGRDSISLSCLELGTVFRNSFKTVV